MFQQEDGKASENDFYNRIATIVLESCNVNYTPDGVKSFRDGSPTQITMELQFKETELLTKDRINEVSNMPYFSRFPLIGYDIKGNKQYKLLPDILRRVKLRSNIRNGSFLFDKYNVKHKEKPEDVAFKWFGDAEYHWIILMTNNVTDRYYQWSNDATSV